MKQAPSTRVAPSSPTDEQAVLGLALRRPEYFHAVNEILGDKPAFFEKPHAEIWDSLCRWYRDHNDRPNATYLVSESVSLEYAGIELPNAAMLSPNLPESCNELLKLWRLRQTRDLSASLARCCDAGDDEGREAVLRDLNECNDVSDSNGLQLSCIADAPEVPIPLFDNGIPRAGFGLLIGADGAGKGFLLTDLLLSCAIGKPVSVPTLARRGEPLHVLYLSYEDSASILKWRFDRMCEGAGMDVSVWRNAEKAGRLSFLTEPEPLYIQAAHDVPKGTDALARLRQHIINHHVDLVAVDPLSACAILQNENDNSALNVVACGLRAMAADTGCAVLLVHHTSKAGRHISGDHQSARGGSALGGAARWCLSLTQDADDKFLLDAAVSKNSYGRRVYDIMLSRDPDTGILREMTGDEIGKAKDMLLDAVIQFVADHPSLEIAPYAVQRNNSAPAKQLIQAVNAKPREAYEAIQRALKCGSLILEERPRANRSGTFEVLTVPDYGDENEVPF